MVQNIEVDEVSSDTEWKSDRSTIRVGSHFGTIAPAFMNMNNIDRENSFVAGQAPGCARWETKDNGRRKSVHELMSNR